MKKMRDPSSEIPWPKLAAYHSEFLADRLIELEMLKNYVLYKDIQEMSKLLHKWKGFSSPYGFGELGYLAAELEECLEISQSERCADLIKQVEDYLATK